MLSAKIGSLTGTFKDFAVNKMPGEYAEYDATTLSFGEKVHFDLSAGTLDAPFFVAGLGMKF